MINVIEDMDADGTEDAYDKDIDGDGFTNEEEIAYGSDPLDRNSLINRPPEDITILGGRIKENEQVGVVVARFIGIDADGNESLTYQLVEYSNEWEQRKLMLSEDVKSSLTDDENQSAGTIQETDNSSINNLSIKETENEALEYQSPFVISPRGILRAKRSLDFETEPTIHFVKIRAVDDYNESIDRNFSIRLINVIEDIDEDGIEDFYDEDMDGDGFTNAEEITEGTNPRDQYSNPKKPILFTNDASSDDNGSFILSGGVLTNGEASISDFGFVLTPKISVDDDSLWIRGVGKPRDFSLLVDKLPFEPVMYFRAWAKNIGGYGIGPVKKVRMEEAPLIWWGEVDERPGNWKSSNWFGNFKYYEQGWLYHGRLGWLYSSPAEENSVWLWKEGRGWLWTKESAWPYLWWNKRKDWLYLVPGKVGQPPHFYDYSTQSY